MHFLGIFLSEYRHFHQYLSEFQLTRLQASNPKHAPPGGFLETTFFGKLIHRQVEIRLSAKIPTLGEAVRALFSKWPPKYNI